MESQIRHATTADRARRIEELEGALAALAVSGEEVLAILFSDRSVSAVKLKAAIAHARGLL